MSPAKIAGSKPKRKAKQVKATQNPNGSGRKSSYTLDMDARICSELINGKSLIEICDADGMPDRQTVYNWMDAHPDFSTRCARAREGQGDFMDHQIMVEARNATPETAQVARVRIGAYQWRASKLAPKRYGDRLVNEHSGPGGGPMQFEGRMTLVEEIIANTKTIQAKSEPA